MARAKDTLSLERLGYPSLIYDEPKTEGDPKIKGIASKDKGEQNGRI